MSQTIGILLSKRVLLRAVSGENTYENLDFYYEFATIYGLKPIFFSITDIDLRKNVVKAYYKTTDSKFINNTFEIPRVIHNRTMPFQQKDKKIIDSLINELQVKIYNEKTRYRKFDVHQLLVSNNQMLHYLPSTSLLTPANLFQTIRKYNTCYIKPVSSGLGRGIIRVDRLSKFSFIIHRMVNRRHVKIKCIRKQLWKKIVPMLSFQPYIVQQGINLAKLNACPFDVRVSVQRNDQGNWQISGMATKVAKQGHYLTNVAQGGNALSLPYVLEQIPNIDPKKVIEDISKVALLCVSILDEHDKGLADVGLDIGIDPSGHPYFIELNGMDLRYSFKVAGEMEMWRNTFRNPVGYGKYLIRQINNPLPLYPEINQVNNKNSSATDSLLPVIWRPISLLPVPFFPRS